MNASVLEALLLGPAILASATLLPLVYIRLVAYRRDAITPHAVAAEVGRVALGEPLDVARVGCLSRELGGPLVAGLAAAVACRGRTAEEVSAATSAAVEEEYARLESADAWLSLFATAGPLFGLASAVLVLASGLGGTGAGRLPGHIDRALYALLGGICITLVALVAHTAIGNRNARSRARVTRLLVPVFAALAGPKQGGTP